MSRAEAIRRVFELLGLADEATRHKLLSQWGVKSQQQENLFPYWIVSDNVSVSEEREESPNAQLE